MEPTHVRLTIPDSIDPTTLMGPADRLLRRIEDAFDAMDLNPSVAPIIRFSLPCR